MELYNVSNIPLSSDIKLKEIQLKILNGQQLTMGEKMLAGRDHPVRIISSYYLKQDHVYRSVKESVFKIYLDTGFIFSDKPNDEYKEYIEDGKIYNNNKGIDWYLGGAALKYGGGDFIIECPAYKDYFYPAFDNGNHLSFDPNVRHFKSSGTVNPIPTSFITRIFDLREYKKHINEENAEKFIKIIENKNYEVETNMGKIR